MTTDRTRTTASPPATAGDQTAAPLTEELRLGIVMSGGVSLAVWMGGVAAEIEKLTRRQGLYGDLCRELRVRPVVDVITGTSAGGLNGALLAAATVHGTTLGGLRDLWVDKADFVDLLRDPKTPDPPSLLKGDEYFLKELRDVFKTLITTQPRTVDTLDPAVRLVVTTTLLGGTFRRFEDVTGHTVLERSHLGLFQFDERATDATRKHPVSLDPVAVDTTAASPEGGDFAASDAANRLALAARCSAAHPGGFEAAFVPIGSSHGDSPDMAAVALWPVSQWTLDGGLLANRPLRQAIDLISEQPAVSQVRRLLLLITPQETTGADQAADPTALPTLLQALSASANIPRQQSIVGELDAIKSHNDRVARLRSSREKALQDPAQIVAAVRELQQSWRDSRHRGFVAEVVERLLRSRPVNVELATETLTETVLRLEGASITVPDAVNERLRDGDAWPYHAMALGSFTHMLVSYLRRALRLVPVSATVTQTTLNDQLRALTEILVEVLALHEREITAWVRLANRMLDQSGAPGEGSADVDEDLGRLARRLGATTGATVDALVEALNVPLPGESDAAGAERQAIRDFCAHLEALRGLLNGGDEPALWLATLVLLDVSQTNVVGDRPSSDQRIDFMQISANAPALGGPPVPPDKKLTGIQLAHFGAFYKRCWRQNDWMYGRLDGAYRLTAAVLAPRRLIQLGLSTERAVDLVTRLALGTEPPPDADPLLLSQWLRQGSDEQLKRVRKELAFLGAEQDPPRELPECVGWVARRLQIEILQQELPDLVLRVLDDEDRGALVSGPTRAFLNTAAAEFGFPTSGSDQRAQRKAYEKAMKQYRKAPQGADHGDAAEKADSPRPPIGVPNPKAAERVFRANTIPREQLADDLGSDHSTLVLSKAALVAATVGSGSQSGLGPLKAVLASLRRVLAIVRALSVGVLRKTRMRVAVSTLAVTAAAAGFALAVLGQDWNDWLVGLGAVVGLSVLALAVFRTRDAVARWWLIAFVVTWVSGVFYAAERSGGIVDTVIVVVLSTLATGVLVAGFEGLIFRWNSKSRRGRWALVCTLVGLVIIGAGVVCIATDAPVVPGLPDTTCQSRLNHQVFHRPDTGTGATVPTTTTVVRDDGADADDDEAASTETVCEQLRGYDMGPLFFVMIFGLGLTVIAVGWWPRGRRSAPFEVVLAKATLDPTDLRIIVTNVSDEAKASVAVRTARQFQKKDLENCDLAGAHEPSILLPGQDLIVKVDKFPERVVVTWSDGNGIRTWSRRRSRFEPETFATAM